MSIIRRRFALLALILITLSSLTLAASQYTITDLGSTATYLFSLNDIGQCLLYYEVGSGNGEYYSYLWNQGNTTRFDDSYWSMNNSGQMVSESSFRDSDGTVSLIPSWISVAYTIIGGNIINDSGQYVGASISPDWRLRATIWNSAQGTCQWMGVVDDQGDASIARAVNNLGQVVGEFFCGSADYDGAFFWDTASGEITVIGQNLRAYRINDVGQVLCDDYKGHYYLWDNGELRDLGPLAAGSINNAGVIAGAIQNENLQFDAVLWQNDRIIRLDDYLPADSGWDLLHADQINNVGQIAGLGLLNGEQHAFLLTPIPEPATMAMFLLGGLALARRRKH